MAGGFVSSKKALSYILSLFLFTSPFSIQAKSEFILCDRLVGGLSKEFVASEMEKNKQTILKENRMIRDRTLTTYNQFLGDGFSRHLSSLLPSSWWIDFGGGQAIAAQEILNLGQKVIVVDPSPKVRRRLKRLAQLHRENFRFVPQFIEQLNKIKIKNIMIGSDLFGPLHYALHPDEILKAELNQLAVGATFYSGSFFRMEFLSKRGRVIDTNGYYWLKQIKGIRLIRPRHSKDFSHIEIQIIDRNIQIPPLYVDRFFGGGEPYRAYRFEK